MQVQRKLTVVDDVPHAGDPVQRRRLTELLVQLARSSRFPVALIVTGSHAPSGDAGRSGSSSRGASFQGWHRVSRLSSDVWEPRLALPVTLPDWILLVVQASVCLEESSLPREVFVVTSGKNTQSSAC